MTGLLVEEEDRTCDERPDHIRVYIAKNGEYYTNNCGIMQLTVYAATVPLTAANSMCFKGFAGFHFGVRAIII